VVVVLVFGVVVGLVSAMQVDWRPDNTYYVDRIWAVRDAPGALPVGRDTLYTAEGVYPSLVPENDLVSLEGLVGTVSALLGGHPLSWLACGASLVGVSRWWRRGGRGVWGVTRIWWRSRHHRRLLVIRSRIGSRAFCSCTGRMGWWCVGAAGGGLCGGALDGRGAERWCGLLPPGGVGG
jgi:hypothetical protein